jgi:transcriptional regulator with XRE-family HTH domain
MKTGDGSLCLQQVNNYSMIDNEVVNRIAQKIRMTRLEKNMTIQQLATRTNVSKGLLSKIENSRTVPSLPVFITLVQSLDISLKEFFQDMVLINGKGYLLVKKANYAQMDREARPGFNYQYILSQTLTTCTMEAVILHLEPGAKGRPSTTDGYEFKYIISGNCEYHINNAVLNLEEGDSIYFDASVPHLPVNNSGMKVTMLVIYFILSKT